MTHGVDRSDTAADWGRRQRSVGVTTGLTPHPKLSSISGTVRAP
jgi:hypothetical protein